MVKQVDKRTKGDAVIEISSITASADFIRIDGKTYDLLSMDDVGLATSARIRRLMKRIEALESSDEPSEADEVEYRDRLIEIARVAYPSLGTEVADAMSIRQLGDITKAFFVHTALKSPSAMMADKLLKESNGQPSSADSNGSTAAPSLPGSTSR